MSGPQISASHLALLEAAHDLVTVTPRRMFEALAADDHQYRRIWMMYGAAYEDHYGRDTEPGGAAES